MRKITIVMIVCLALMFTVVSCKKKAAVEPTIQQPEKVERVEEVTPQLDKPVLTEEELFEKRTLQEANEAGYLKKINFDFDKYDIRDDMKPNLHRNADWLLKHSTVLIAIEGHCDERGTIEYNMALGEKRAKAAKNYLATLGVSSDRMKAVSYGKSKPIYVGASTEEEHYQNRRAEFIIIKK